MSKFKEDDWVVRNDMPFSSDQIGKDIPTGNVFKVVLKTNEKIAFSYYGMSYPEKYFDSYMGKLEDMPLNTLGYDQLYALVNDLDGKLSINLSTYSRKTLSDVAKVLCDWNSNQPISADEHTKHYNTYIKQIYAYLGLI